MVVPVTGMAADVLTGMAQGTAVLGVLIEIDRVVAVAMTIEAHNR